MREVTHKSSIYKNYKNFRRLDELLEQFLNGPMDISSITQYWDNLKNGERLDIFLGKLEKDGNIVKKPNGKYYLTAEGYFLTLDGGYKEREIEKDRLAYRVDQNEARVRRATIWAAIFGGILVVWEIIKFILDRSPETINYFN